MFTGFGTNLPEYEIITPHTKQSFTIRSMTVQEEEILKGSMQTPNKILPHLNQCIFDCLVKKPDKISSYEDFLTKLSIKDRDALLYGLYHSTYEEIRNYEVQCSQCGKKHPVTIEASETFDIKMYTGKDNILNKKVRVELPKTKGVTATLKQPSLKDEASILSAISQATDIETESLIIDSFEQDIPDQTKPVIFKDKNDIVEAYSTLTPLDKRAIRSKYKEEFGKYGIELKMQVDCPGCSNKEVVDIDLVENFFRSMYAD